MNHKPLVSVILPTYNRASTISRAIDSVLDQTYNHFEIIVIDDNSDDNTDDIVGQYGSSVQHLCHDVNKGASAARNTGIEQSNGDFLAFIDSDDEWHSQKLERQIEIFDKKSKNLGAVYTGFYKKRGDTRELGNIPTKSGDIYVYQLMTDWVNPTSTVMVRKECIKKVGKFDTTLPARQDYDLWLRIAREYHFEYIKQPLVTMYVDSDNRITDDIDARMTAHQCVLESIRDDIDKLPFHQRRRAFGMQYYNMGRYLQKNRKFNDSFQYLIKSIKYNPLNWKAAIAALLTVIHQDGSGDNFIKMKNTLRKYLRGLF